MYNEKRIQDTKTIYDILLPVLKELYNQGCRSLIETSPPRGGQNLKLMKVFRNSLLKDGLKIMRMD